MKARKARKKRKTRKNKRHEGTQTRKGRKHIRPVGMSGMQARKARRYARHLIQYIRFDIRQTASIMAKTASVLILPEGCFYCGLTCVCSCIKSRCFHYSQNCFCFDTSRRMLLMQPKLRLFEYQKQVASIKAKTAYTPSNYVDKVRQKDVNVLRIEICQKRTSK